MMPGETPHHCVVGVVDQVVIHRHDDQTIGLVGDAVGLAEDPGDGVGVEVDVAVAAGVTSGRTGYRIAGVKAPGRDSTDDRDLGAVLNRVSRGRAAHAEEREHRREHEKCESDAAGDADPAHVVLRLYPR